MSPQRLQNPPKPPKQGTPGPGCQTSPKECIKIGKNREESETVSPQRLQNLRNLRNREPQSQDAKRTPEPGCQTSPKEYIKIGKKVRLPKQGTPGPGCQTSPKECIKIGKNREESETVSPQRLQNLRNLRNRLQNLRNRVQNLRNREPQGQDAKRHLRNALR